MSYEARATQTAAAAAFSPSYAADVTGSDLKENNTCRDLFEGLLQACSGGRGWGVSNSLPSAGVAVFAEVSARLTGGQLQQLVPLSLPLLLSVHQA